MDYMAFSINHDVPVMSVFNIEYIVEQAISSKTLDKILLCLFEIIPKVLLVECPQIPRFLADSWLRELLLQAVYRCCVRDKLNHA
jgi:hypothetical protein